MLTVDQISKQFSGTLYAPNYMDVQTGCLWDKFSTTSPSRVMGNFARFFHSSVGDWDLPTARTKSELETSMWMNHRLPAPEAFSVQRLVFTFGESDSISRFVENVRFRFWLGQRWYLRSPLACLPQGKQILDPLRVCRTCGSIFLGDGACPNCKTDAYHLPFPPGEKPGRQLFMDLSINLVIDNQCSFGVDLFCRDLQLADRIDVWCHLEGLHARGVQ